MTEKENGNLVVSLKNPGTGAGKGRQGNAPGPNRPGQGGGKGPQQKKQKQPQKQQQATVVEVRPLATQARLKRRHWGLMGSFLVLVALPLAVVAYYLWLVAVDQYSSTAGFTVRGEESGAASDILGGLAQFAGSGTGSDSDVLFEFIQSQDIVEKIDAQLDLRNYYATHWEQDPVFSLWTDASIEDLVWYWQRVVRISLDRSSGLIDLQVLAFDADMAQKLAQAIVTESQKMINALNTQAREDAMRYANEDLDVAVGRMKVAREALTQFRTRTQIVDPESDIQGRMGVLNNLQQQLAEALIEYDLLIQTSNNDKDPRTLQALRRIDVTRKRIADERLTFATDGTDVGEVGEDYPTLIAEFERLSVDKDVAEVMYRAALTALDVARANASRQSRYLAAFVRPTQAEDSEFPQRWVLFGLAGLFLMLAWGIMSLIYYSIRDRS